ncbi:MAG TPA: DUF58 domain-containing protein [Thermoanaerobaculia bacterium]|nr:DUF58 domain-containing protein [Thermoanaerobaculia bacterium]
MGNRSPEFKGVVRLTRIGMGYLAFTLVIGFAAINTGNNSLYIGLAFMLGGLIISGVASKGGLKRIEVEFVSVDEAWAGRPAVGILRATNSSRIWNVRDVLLISDELEEPLLFPLIPRGTTIQREAGFLFRRRGRLQFKTASLYTRYPFGLFLKKRRVSFVGEAIVYPGLLDPPLELLTADVLAGEKGRTERIGPGSEVHAFREYIRGDSLRQVHWKKSASIGRWIMKQTETESTQTIEVAVDTVMPPGATEEEFEQMISEAATYLHHAISSRLEVVLHTPAGTIRGGGDAARRPIFEALALLEPAGEGWGRWTDPQTVVFSLRKSNEPLTA